MDKGQITSLMSKLNHFFFKYLFYVYIIYDGGIHECQTIVIINMHDMHVSFSGRHDIIEDVPSRLSNSSPAMSAYLLDKGMQRASDTQDTQGLQRDRHRERDME